MRPWVNGCISWGRSRTGIRACRCGRCSAHPGFMTTLPERLVAEVFLSTWPVYPISTTRDTRPHSRKYSMPRTVTPFDGVLRASLALSMDGKMDWNY